MSKKLYLVIGCPGSGKSWVCERLGEAVTYIPHDKFIGREHLYVSALLLALNGGSKPVVTEAPFSISKITEQLESRGVKPVPVFIQEHPATISSRYLKREGKPIPQGHLTRQITYAERAKEQRAFSGTSEQVLHHLKELTHG